MHKLTERQRDVLFYAACGMGEKETAREMNLGVQTVKDHRARAVQILGAASLTAAVVIAIHYGEIQTVAVLDLCRDAA